MKVVFRVDASARMGIGHLIRCLTLAEALREGGAQMHFICRAHAGDLIALLRQKAMPVTTLPAPAAINTARGEDYAAWLGVSQAEDAGQTIEALDGEKPDWLIVDHYGLDVEWERRVRPHVSKLMVIDDLANRQHDCDVLLDQNYSAEGGQRYAGLVPDACRLLVGPRYALLRPEYATSRKTPRVRDGQVGRVMVFFGGTDPRNMTGMALEALANPGLKHLEVDVVVGANNPHREALVKQSRERAEITIYGPHPHLVDFMAKADLAIGAGGTTTWERLCLGLPSLVVSIAENQVPSCIALHRSRLINYLGFQDEVDVTGFFQEMVQMIGDPGRLMEMSLAGQALVDGRGVDIVNETLGCR